MCEPMQILFHMRDPKEHAALRRMLETWCELACVSIPLSNWTPGGTGPCILLWDLDSGAPPVLPENCKLIVCSSCPRAAITSYSFHPAGFLRKPIRMRELTAALLRCRSLWWDFLDRIDIFSDRCKLYFPISSLIWAEGERRGCLIHGFQVSLLSRESLAALAQRLPQALFLRCHRSFLVNLCHIRCLDTEGLHMADGAVIPLSRANLRAAQRTYDRFCQWRDGGIPIPPQKEGML